MITYSALASLFLILGVVILLVALGIYIKLDIYSVRAELNGRATKRQLRKLRRNFRTSVASNSTGSFYHNTMSELPNTSTGTTGSFGNTPYSSPTGALYGEEEQVHNQGTALRIEDLGVIEQVEYRTGMFEEDETDADLQGILNTEVQNRYHQVIIQEESSNVRF